MTHPTNRHKGAILELSPFADMFYARLSYF